MLTLKILLLDNLTDFEDFEIGCFPKLFCSSLPDMLVNFRVFS